MSNKSTYNKIIESRLLYEVDSLFKKYSQRKLRFYEAGLVVYPVKYIGNIAIGDATVEAWENIRTYGFDKPKGLYRNANKGIFEDTTHEGLDYCLRICTDGIVKRCVNYYGMSVFGLMGFLLNDSQVKIIQGIFDTYGVKKDSNSEI